jgi:predicted phage terminase large subunit-like protein
MKAFERKPWVPDVPAAEDCPRFGPGWKWKGKPSVKVERAMKEKAAAKLKAQEKREAKAAIPKIKSSLRKVRPLRPLNTAKLLSVDKAADTVIKAVRDQNIADRVQERKEQKKVPRRLGRPREVFESRVVSKNVSVEKAADGRVLTQDELAEKVARGAALVKQPWRFLPHTFAMHLSGGKWFPYLYLVFLSNLLAAVISKGNGRVIVELPPRHGKSSFISQWVPAWFLANWPDESVILTTYEATFAASWGKKVRNILQDNAEELGVHVAQDSSAAAMWQTTAGGSMFTAGVGGPITGKGAKIAIIDDPHKNWKEAMSGSITKSIQEWYDSTFYTRLEPNGTLIILHTRWSESDLIGYCLREHPEENWIVVRFPALAEEEDILGRKVGQALCPERYDEIALEKIHKNLGTSMWNGLYQQRPSAMEGEIWLRSRWQYYKVPPKCSFVLQSWDTGFKKGEDASFSVCQTWGVFPGGYCLLNQWRFRVEWPELERAAKSQYFAWSPNVVLIEDKASGQSLIQALRRDTHMPVIAMLPEDNGSKEVRSMAVTPMHEAGLLWLPDPDENDEWRWVGDMVDRFTVFPNGVWKDEVDTTSQALAYLREFSVTTEVIGALPRKSGAMLHGFRNEIKGTQLRL